MDNIIAEISCESNIEGTLNSTYTLNGTISTCNVITGEVIPIVLSYVNYEGSYKVTPKVSSQVLETAHKVMSEDVTVAEIPYFEVSNIGKGHTVYIGKEIGINGN